MPDEMTMVERVARAITRDINTFHNDHGVDDIGWQSYISAAEEAIKAMREPTKSMLEAGEATIYEDRAEAQEWSLASTRDGWQAMVDAALKEHEGEKG